MSATPEWITTFTRVLKDDDIVKESYAISLFRDGAAYCKLCDARVPADETNAQHLRRHRRELREYRKRREAEVERRRREALELRRRERDMERRVLGERTSSLPELKRLKNRVTSIRYKVNHPEKHGRDAWAPDEMRRLQAQLDEAVAAVAAYEEKEAT